MTSTSKINIYLNLYLSKRAILGKKATNGFPIYFTSGKVNKPLVILRTVLHLRDKDDTNDP